MQAMKNDIYYVSLHSLLPIGLELMPMYDLLAIADNNTDGNADDDKKCFDLIL